MKRIEASHFIPQCKGLITGQLHMGKLLQDIKMLPQYIEHRSNGSACVSVTAIFKIRFK